MNTVSSRKVTLDEVHVLQRVHGQDVGGEHAALVTDESSGDLRPAAGRGTQIHDQHTWADQSVRSFNSISL